MNNDNLISVYTFVRKPTTKYSYTLHSVEGKDIYANNLPIGIKAPYTAMRGISFSPVSNHLMSKGFNLACTMLGKTGKRKQFGLKNSKLSPTIYYSDDRFERGLNFNNGLLFVFSESGDSLELYVFENMANKKELIYQQYQNNELDLVIDKLPLTID